MGLVVNKSRTAKGGPYKLTTLIMFGRTLKHLSLTIKSKIRQEGERKRVEGKESPERKNDWEKERGGMSDFAAVFFLPSLLCPRGVPLW